MSGVCEPYLIWIWARSVSVGPLGPVFIFDTVDHQVIYVKVLYRFVIGDHSEIETKLIRCPGRQVGHDDILVRIDMSRRPCGTIYITDPER